MQWSPDILTAMRRAVELARNGLGKTSPNPVVGCVILDSSGVVVGEGWHEKAGQPHAEVMALTQAGERARGGTVVVTLEPCAHRGRTGPCAHALVEAGVAQVVAAVPDPTPTAGGGAKILRSAGVNVRFGALENEARDVNIAWLTAVTRQRPYLLWKFAATLDGRSAAADGTSRWITSDPARLDVHRIRSEVDTVLVGVGTVLADDPALTVRLSPYTGPQPRRVIADSQGRTPPTATVLTDHAAPTWVATSAEVGAGADDHLDLVALMSELYRQGSRSILLEGGPTLAGAALRLGLVDRVCAYVAPTLLGAGPAALSEAGVSTMKEALSLHQVEVTQLGSDLKIVGDVHPPKLHAREDV